MCLPLKDAQQEFGYTGAEFRRESEARVTELRFFRILG